MAKDCGIKKKSHCLISKCDSVMTWCFSGINSKVKPTLGFRWLPGVVFFSSPFCFLVGFIETITQGPARGLLFWKSPLAVSSEVLSSFQQFTLLLSVAVFTHLSPFSVNKTCLSNFCVNQIDSPQHSAAAFTRLLPLISFGNHTLGLLRGGRAARPLGL